jgi:hypothetical protein
MSTLQEIEQAIEQLPPSEAHRLSQWLVDRLNAKWDEQFESDVESGRLDAIAEQAIAEHRAGKSREFPSGQ